MSLRGSVRPPVSGRTSLTLLAVTAGLFLGHATALDIDPTCGDGYVYIAALTCGVDDTVVLSCIPRPLREDICGLPKTTFATQLCVSKGKFKQRNVHAAMDTSISGCYKIDDGRLTDFGVVVPEGGFPYPAYDALCEQLPLVVTATTANPPEGIDSVYDGFEGENPLSAWKVSGVEAQYVVVQCGPAVAEDGDCAVKVPAGCNDLDGWRYSKGGTNTLSRDFSVVYVEGCVEGLQRYDLTFAYKWVGQDISAYPDSSIISVAINNGVFTEVVRFTTFDYAFENYQTAIVPLGDLALGEKVKVDMQIVSTNARDCAVDSFIMVDNIRIGPAYT